MFSVPGLWVLQTRSWPRPELSGFPSADPSGICLSQPIFVDRGAPLRNTISTPNATACATRDQAALPVPTGSW